MNRNFCAPYFTVQCYKLICKESSKMLAETSQKEILCKMLINTMHCKAKVGLWYSKLQLVIRSVSWLTNVNQWRNQAHNFSLLGLRHQLVSKFHLKVWSHSSFYKQNLRLHTHIWKSQILASSIIIISDINNNSLSSIHPSLYIGTKNFGE